MIGAFEGAIRRLRAFLVFPFMLVVWEGLERSGRLVGQISSGVLPDPT